MSSRNWGGGGGGGKTNFLTQKKKKQFWSLLKYVYRAVYMCSSIQVFAKMKYQKDTSRVYKPKSKP
jgi:hypothetical protein